MICGKTELCIFDGAPAQTMVESATFVDIHPTTLIEGKNANNIEFVINGSETEYLDLNDTMIYLKLQVRNKDGSALPAASATAPTNYMLNSLFSDATLSLNDTVIEGGDRLYAYKSTIATIFNFSEDTKRIQLESAGYSEEQDKRKSWIKQSREFELTGALRFDFFNQPKYLLPGVNVRIQLQRSKASFTLADKANTAYIDLKKAILYVRRVKVNTALSLGHQLGLIKANAVYPITKSQVISYTISAGSMSYFKDNIFSSLRLPKFVVVGFVSAKAFNGAFSEDPFKFKHFDVNSVGLLCDGQSVPFRNVYEPDFANGLFVRDYQMSMIHNTEHFNTNKNNGITMEMFEKEGYSLFTFNLTPDFDMSTVQAPRDGNLRLDVKFAKALPDPINVIIYGLFDSSMQIGKNKQVIKPL